MNPYAALYCSSAQPGSKWSLNIVVCFVSLFQRVKACKLVTEFVALENVLT
jgi:hypothetical protein